MSRLARISLILAALAASTVARAHPVTVDGNPSEWLTRVPSVDNAGIVARTATGQGELIWRDAVSDTRTDIATPEVIADIVAFQVTGDATGLYFLVRRQAGQSFVGAPIQLQIAIDVDRVAGSGQDFFTGFADTKVANGARWEFLVQTLFGSAGQAQVIDASMSKVADATAVQGLGGDVEIGVAWAALGLAGPPASPLRLSIAAFRAQAADLTVDVGGAMISNALDAVTDYGNPAASAYPISWTELQDGVVDYSLDVWFNASGEVYSPLLIDRFLANSSGGGADEWYMIRNVSPLTIPLDGYKLGDEETPDQGEGMFSFPPGASLLPGGTYVVARNGSSYQATFGAPPDAELPPGGTTAPDMVAFTAWTNGAVGAMQLANAGDELLLLGPSNTILDVVTYGAGTYPGITPFTPAPAADEVLVRKAGVDTDSTASDFVNAGAQCLNDSQCAGGGACAACVLGACEPRPDGLACDDGNACTASDSCSGGTCVGGSAVVCDDSNPCTDDLCNPSTGCMFVNDDANSCSDSNACTTSDHCVSGACEGTYDFCDDGNACTADSCNPASGCVHAAITCDDGNRCTFDTCSTTMGCTYTPTPGVACGDGNACNGAELCDAAGSCLAGTPLACDDANPCTIDACDAATGCSSASVTDGTACTSTACSSATCKTGACTCEDPPPVDPGGCGCGQSGSGRTSPVLALLAAVMLRPGRRRRWIAP
jgi:hypothetical protein